MSSILQILQLCDNHKPGNVLSQEADSKVFPFPENCIGLIITAVFWVSFHLEDGTFLESSWWRQRKPHSLVIIIAL